MVMNSSIKKNFMIKTQIKIQWIIWDINIKDESDQNLMYLYKCLDFSKKYIIKNNLVITVTILKFLFDQNKKNNTNKI